TRDGGGLPHRGRRGVRRRRHPRAQRLQGGTREARDRPGHAQGCRGGIVNVIGKPISRVDGPEKVTGSALYTSEIPKLHIAYAAIVPARVASARVTAIDTTEAEAATGVLGILTHENTPKIAEQPPLIPSLIGHAAPGETFFPLQDNVVHYW